MTTFDLSFRGLGSAQGTFDQVATHTSDIIELYVDPSTRQVVTGWQVLASFMWLLARDVRPDEADGVYWFVTSEFLRKLMIKVDEYLAANGGAE